jgi:hypothetical protein
MDTAAGIRRRVAALGPRGRGARVPEELRQEIGRYTRQRSGEGAALGQIAAETGISRESLRRWMSAVRRRPRRVAEMVPVTVVREAGGDGVVIVTPGGYRVEGLDVEGAAVLLRRLA